jgi:hypothetical protein
MKDVKAKNRDIVGRGEFSLINLRTDKLRLIFFGVSDLVKGL